MKRRLFSALLCLVTALALALPAAAAELDSAAFYPQSRIADGLERDCDGEYLVLNNDGTGVVLYNHCAYAIQWSWDGTGEFTFKDSANYSFTGQLDENGVLSGHYRRSDYVYLHGDLPPVTKLEADSWGQGLPYVKDKAGILSDKEEAALSKKAAGIVERYGCEVYLVTVKDMEDYTFYGRTGRWNGDGSFYVERTQRGPTGSRGIETLAEEVRVGYDLGWGSEHDCIVLLVSMAERDFDLVQYGGNAKTAFTDAAGQYIRSQFLDDFRRDKWAAGAGDYMDACEYALKMAAAGKPMRNAAGPVNPLLALGASALIAFVVAFIICKILKGSMKGVEAQTAAGSYIPQNGVVITERYDQFTHMTETRVYDPPRKSGGGGGGGFHSSSSGHSHSSGKF